VSSQSCLKDGTSDDVLGLNRLGSMVLELNKLVSKQARSCWDVGFLAFDLHLLSHLCKASPECRWPADSWQHARPTTPAKGSARGPRKEEASGKESASAMLCCLPR